MYHHYNGITRKNDFLKKQRKMIHSGNLSLKRKEWLIIEHLKVTAAARFFFFFAKEPEKADQKMKGGEGKM
jgi:hypothetical protein